MTGRKVKKIDKHLFQETMKEGKNFHSELVSIRFKKSVPEDREARFSAVVPKKSYKKAVDRNKLKRRGRAIFRKMTNEIAPGAYILFFRKGALEIPFKDLDGEVRNLFGKMR